MSGLAARRIVAARAMPQILAKLLDETPQVRDPARQQALTDRFLMPALPGLSALCRQLRAETDTVLTTRPAAGAKPYPLGWCLEITVDVQGRLDHLEPAAFAGPAAEGCAALTAFCAAGGEVRRVWGDLRGQYFQNAMIIGALYVDVANDTVVTTKPKVEILPFAEAGFRPIAGYGHYARIARGYWNARVLPNHLLPELAPYLPLIQLGADHRVGLGASTSYMLGLNLSRGFAPAARALAAPALAAPAFEALRGALQGGPFEVAADPAGGRADALARCNRYRVEGWATNAAAFACAMAAAREADRRLASIGGGLHPFVPVCPGGTASLAWRLQLHRDRG